MNKRSKILLLLTAASASILAASLFLNRDTGRGMIRQKQDVIAVEEYLKRFGSSVSDSEAPEPPRETFIDSSPEETEELQTIVDDRYYERGGITYTPDFARGTLDCVLEIPSISLKRGVYTGTREEIEYDLSIWLTAAASPGLTLGKTHYAIYGHNHPVQDLSFNRLKDVRLGETFTLTKEDQVYLYRVTDIFADWRNSGRRKYAVNLDQDPSLCFIFTCGRDHWLIDGPSTRYRDYIVEGTLEGVYSVAEWRDKLAGNVPEVHTETFTARNLIKTALEAEILSENGEGVSLQIAQKSGNGSVLQGAVLSLLNPDGNEVLSWVQEDGPKEILLREGTWVIAVTGLPEGYEEPPGKEIRVSPELTTIVTIGETTEEEAVPWSEILLTTSMIAAVFTAAFSILFLVSSARPKRR